MGVGTYVLRALPSGSALRLQQIVAAPVYLTYAGFSAPCSKLKGNPSLPSSGLRSGGTACRPTCFTLRAWYNSSEVKIPMLMSSNSSPALSPVAVCVSADALVTVYPLNAGYQHMWVTLFLISSVSRQRMHPFISDWVSAALSHPQFFPLNLWPYTLMPSSFLQLLLFLFPTV